MSTTQPANFGSIAPAAAKPVSRMIQRIGIGPRLRGLSLGPASSNPTLEFYDFEKRLLDIILSAVALVLLSSPLGIIALLIRLTSPGPVFFRQQRVGQHGAPFTMLKFRTMHCDAPRYGYSPKDSADPRITGLGRFLRQTSLDELPQLINVLWGEMSLVGPRPEMPFIVEQYTPFQRRRLCLKPGITGLWQVSPYRSFPILEHLEYDLYYLDHRSAWLDALIVLQTFVAAARGI